MKSSWRQFERNTSDIAWGILCIISTIACIVGIIVVASNTDKSMIFILVPLAILFLIGAILFFKNSSKEKRKKGAAEIKKIEDTNYCEIKKIGEIIDQSCNDEKFSKTAKINIEPNYDVDIENLLIKNINFSCYIESGIQFENFSEFLAFSFKNKNLPIKWTNNEEAINLFRKGYEKFEEGNIKECIDLISKCLQLNPIFIIARFELANALFSIRKFKKGIQILLDMTEYISEDKDRALFYRRLGYAFIEQSQPDLAYACYRYSQKFENNITAENELTFIQQHFQITINDFDVSLLLKENNIPFLNEKR